MKDDVMSADTDQIEITEEMVNAAAQYLVDLGYTDVQDDRPSRFTKYIAR